MEPEAKKHKHLSVLVTVFLMLFVVAGAVSGVWYFMNQRIEEERSLADERVNLLQEQIDELKKTRSLDDKMNMTPKWKAYSDDKYEYSFKYPIDWDLSVGDVSDCRDLTITKPNGDVFSIVSGVSACGRGAEGVRELIKYDVTVEDSKVVLGKRTLLESDSLPTSNGDVHASGYIIVLSDSLKSQNYHHVISMGGDDCSDSSAAESDFKRIIGTIKFD